MRRDHDDAIIPDPVRMRGDVITVTTVNFDHDFTKVTLDHIITGVTLCTIFTFVTNITFVILLIRP